MCSIVTWASTELILYEKLPKGLYLLIQKYLIIVSLFLATALIGGEMPTDKRLVEGMLPNGFHYMIMHNEKPKDRVVIRLLVKAGSLEEDEDQRGLAHFIEHMAFNGTEHFKKNELVRYLESIGMNFGGDLNAETTFGHTLYKLSVPVTGDNVDKALLIVHDWANGMTFDPKEFENERGVVLEEKRLRNTPGFRLYKQFSPLFYNGSRYEKRETIGKESVLRHAPVSKAVEFYKKWYRPELMTLVVVGDIDPKAIEQKIRKVFSGLININHTPPYTRLIADNNTTRTLSVSDKDIGDNSLQINYLSREFGTVTPGEFRSDMLDMMAELMFKQEVPRHLLTPGTKLLGLSMGTQWITPLRRSIAFSADYAQGNAKAALGEVGRIISGYAAYGFDKITFEAVKRQLYAANENNHKRHMDIPSVIHAQQLAKAVENGGVFIDEGYNYRFSKQFLDSVTPDEVNKRFKAIVSNPNRVILFSGSKRVAIDNKEAVSILENAAKEANATHKNTQGTAAFPPRPKQCGSIVSKHVDKTHGIYHYVLENNVSVDFKPTDFAKNQVLFSAVALGGDSIVAPEALDNLHKAARWVVASAPGEVKAWEFPTLLSGKQLHYEFAIDRFDESISASSSTEDFETLLKLIRWQLMEPKIDPAVAKQQRDSLLAALSAKERDPGYRFNKAFEEYYYDNNPRIQFDTAQSIAKLDPNVMLQDFKKAFSGFNRFHITIVGDIDPKTVEKLLPCYLGTLPAGAKKTPYNGTPYPYKKGHLHFNRAYNSTNIANITMQYRTKLPKFSVHTAATINLLQSVLNIRLRNEIREKKSGTYGIGTACTLTRETNNTLVCSISFAADPKRSDALIKDVQTQLAAFIKEGPDAKTLKNAKKEFSVGYRQMLRKNEYWLSLMQLENRFDTPLEAYLKLDTQMASVTAEELKHLSKKIFESDSVIAQQQPDDSNQTEKKQ